MCLYHGGTESEGGNNKELWAFKFRSLVHDESWGKEEMSDLVWGGQWQESWLGLEKKSLLRSLRPKGGGTQGSDKALQCPAKGVEEHQREQGPVSLPSQEVAYVSVPVRRGLVGWQQRPMRTDS